MENYRNFSFFVMCITVVMLFMAWNGDIENLEKKAKLPKEESADLISLQSSTNTDLIKVKTDVLELVINLSGGDIVDSRLLKFNKSADDNTPIHLLQKTNLFSYTVSTGLVGPDGPDGKSRPTYTSLQKEYDMNGKDKLTVALTYENDGVEFVKNFTFYKGSYRIDVSYDIKNSTDHEISVRTFGQIKQTVAVPDSGEANLFLAGSFRGGAYSTDENNYSKISLEDLANPKESEIAHPGIVTKGGWISMIQHYFTTAFIGNAATSNQIYSIPSNNGKEAVMGLTGDIEKIPGHQTVTLKNSLWIGPKNQKEMDALAPHLGLTLDYGWLWFISELLVNLMTFIHSFIGNWGFSIIAVTLIVRGLMYPLTRAQYTSMAKMRLIAPKLQELRERYQSDRERFQKETMNLYKNEKVNPAAGCLPILIQMPIFIALYWALMESVELRQSPFIFWIKDLSVNDPYFILPLLYGVTMFAVQKMSQSQTQMINNIQKNIFLFMPVIFTIMFMFFPAGLTLYWTVSNVITIIQLKFIYSHLEKIGLHTRAKKKAK